MNCSSNQPVCDQPQVDTVRRRGMRYALLTQFFGTVGMQSFENGVLLLYLTVLGLSPVRILVYLALPNGVSMLLRLPVGYAADQRGKKRFGLVGVCLTVVGYSALPLAAFASGGGRSLLIVGGILVLSVGKMFFAAGWHAMIGGLVPEGMRARFYGRMRISFMLGGIAFTALVALLLGKDSPVWMFQVILTALVLCFVLRVVFYTRVPEVERTGRRDGGFWKALGQVLAHSRYVSFVAYVFLLTLFTKGAVNLFALIEKNVMGCDDGTVVLLANATMAGGVLGFFVAGRLIDRVGSRYVFLVCHVAFAVSMLGFLGRNMTPLPPVVVAGAVHVVFGMSGAASGLAIMSEMLALVPRWNKALSTSLCISLLLGGASLSGLISAAILDIGLLRERWQLFGQVLSDYDAVLFGYGVMVVLLVVTLGLVPSVLGPANWEPAGAE